MRASPLSPILSALLFLAAAFAPAHAQRAALPGLTEGVEYKLIEGGKPYRAVPGKVEVAEVFGYGCPHCANFAPMLDSWKRSLPKHAQLVYVPAAFNPADAYARFYFAAEAAKATQVLHPRLFKAIHETGELSRTAELPQIAAWGARVPGVNAKALAAALKDGKTLDAKVQQAHDFAMRSKVPGTPALVIDGRYLVLGNSYQGLLDNANRVIKAIPHAAGKSTAK